MTEPGEDNRRRVLQAIAAGRVRKAPVGPNSPGRFLLDGVEVVDAAVIDLISADMVYVAAGGAPPRLTPDSEWVLTNYT